MTSHQTDLFAPERRMTYGELSRQRQYDLATSDAVKEEVMAVYRAHAGEFIWSNPELRRVKEKYDLGSYFNYTIHTLHREGKIESRNVYHGATTPVRSTSDLAGRRKLKKGEAAPLPYLGYRVEYRYVEAA